MTSLSHESYLWDGSLLGAYGAAGGYTLKTIIVKPSNPTLAFISHSFIHLFIHSFIRSFIFSRWPSLVREKVQADNLTVPQQQLLCDDDGVSGVGGMNGGVSGGEGVSRDNALLPSSSSSSSSPGVKRKRIEIEEQVTPLRYALIIMLPLSSYHKGEVIPLPLPHIYGPLSYSLILLTAHSFPSFVSYIYIASLHYTSGLGQKEP